MKPEFYKTKLDNGLTILFERREQPVCSLFVTSKFGGFYERARHKGIAHFIEHLVFKGTTKRDQLKLKTDIERKGGVLNAFTSEQLTSFFVKLPSNHLELGVDVLSDILLNSLFKDKDIEKERQVIFEEIKMRKDMPEVYVLDKIKQLLYKGDFALPLAGTFESLINIKRKNILDYHSLYTNNNLIITLVGRGDNSDFIELIKERFKGNRPISKLPDAKFSKISKELIEKKSDIHQAHIVVGTHMPSLSDNGKYVAEIIDSILGSGLSSRLFQEIREKRGLAYHTKTYLEQEKDYGYLIAYAGIKPDKIKEVKGLILKEIKKLTMLDKKDFEEIKEQLIGSYEIKNENSINTAISLTINEIAGEAEEFYQYPERISQVKLEDVRKLAKIKNYSFISLAPK